MADGTQQPESSGNAVPDTGALDVHQASAVFANLLDAKPEPEKKEGEGVEENREPEATSETDDPEQPTEKKEPDAGERTYTVDIDGKQVTFTQAELAQRPELLDAVVNGYKAQKASTQKYEEASALRKQAEAESNQARTQRQQYAQGLQMAEGALMVALNEQQRTDWHQLREKNPAEFLKQWHLFNERQAKLQNVQGQRRQLAAAEVQEAQSNLAVTLQNEEQALLGRLPEWKDAKVKAAASEKIAKDLIDRGFSAQQVFGQPNPDGSLNPNAPGIVDHKLLLLAHDAMMYRELQAKAKAAAAKVQALPPKAERPGNAPSQGIDRRTQAFQKLSKTGRVEDAAAVFASFL